MELEMEEYYNLTWADVCGSDHNFTQFYANFDKYIWLFCSQQNLSQMEEYYKPYELTWACPDDNYTHWFSCSQHHPSNTIQHHPTPFYKFPGYVMFLVYLWAIALVVLPAICFALYRLCSKMRSHDVAPVYVINILICDLFQISAHAVGSTMDTEFFTFNRAYDVFYCAALINVFFMMCVSVERYIMIAHPVWYRAFRETRTKVCVSVAIYIFSTCIAVAYFFAEKHVGVLSFLSSVLIVPYILMLFVLVGTWRALSRSFLPHNDQRRIMAILAVILLTYTICFLPFFLYFITLLDFLRISSNFKYNTIYRVVISFRVLTSLSPLFDLIIYVLIRTDGTDLCNTVFCWLCKRQRENTAEPNDATTKV